MLNIGSQYIDWRGLEPDRGRTQDSVKTENNAGDTNAPIYISSFLNK